MAYSVNGLSGTYETPAHTIGYLLKSSWTKSNTTNVLPMFFYDETKPHQIENSSLNDYVKVESGGDSGFSETEYANDNTQGTFEDDIIITVNSVTQLRGKLIEAEIIRILRVNYKATINKSDGSASGIKTWDFPLPKFTRFGVGQEGQRKSFKSQMLLTIHSFYTWSD